METLEKIKFKANQAADLIECIEEILDGAGASLEVNKSLNLMAILVEQMQTLQDMLEDCIIRTK